MNRKPNLTASNTKSSKDSGQHYINLGSYALRTAAEALLDLRGALDKKFLHALDLLFNTNEC